MSSIFETDVSLDALTAPAISRTKELIKESEKLRDGREKANRKQELLASLKIQKAIEATITLTDGVMRIGSSVESSSRIFRRAAKKASLTGFGFINSFGLHFIGVVSRILPGPVVSVVHQRVRALSKDLILAARA
jgi:RHH-type proline utilization regulon transcriptional repressor/proline dehydrogenase/delta 1-pyrroline-5-carboxylate dehydrogenase